MGLAYSPENQKKISDAIKQEVASIDTKGRRELLASIHNAVYDLNAGDSTKITRAQARFATLLVGLAEDQTKASERLESHTRTLVEAMQATLEESKVLRKLTVALLVLTAALLVLTIALVMLEYRPHP